MRLFAQTIAPAIAWWAPLLAFGALPTIGLVAGPSYSSIVIGLAMVQLLSRLAAGQGLPSIDRPIAAIAAVFLLLCWASAAWSIVPRVSLQAALGLTGVLIGMLIFLAGRNERPELIEALCRVLLVAMLLGIAIVCLERALGYPLQSLLSRKPGVDAATKYNRGFDYLVMIVWPVLSHAWQQRRWWAVCMLGVVMGLIFAVTLSMVARVAIAIGLLVLVLAWAAPRLVAIGLAWGIAALIATLPLVLRMLAAHRAALAPYMKTSGLIRLEIWDYMTARVFTHPLRGWGLLTAKYVPIHPDELARYLYTGPRGIYPHNQWLELWVELGALGAAIGVVFALLVLRRIRALAVTAQPFAYAAFASAVIVASTNYEVTTDSWWSALAASAVLFATLGRTPAVAIAHGEQPA
jgi:exopolysaccharide production protein ExoQ